MMILALSILVKEKLLNLDLSEADGDKTRALVYVDTYKVILDS